MGNKVQSAILIFSVVLVLFSAMWAPKISVAIAIVALLVLGVYRLILDSRFRGNDMRGNPLNPEQIKKRRENLDRILELAQSRPRLTNDDVQKALAVSDAAAARYLSYLVDLGKLIMVGERGQQVYYRLPPR